MFLRFYPGLSPWGSACRLSSCTFLILHLHSIFTFVSSEQNNKRFGAQVLDCEDATNQQTSACQTRCGAEDWVFGTSCCTFEEGRAYVIYADAITTTDGGASKEVCGTDTRLAVSQQSTCKNFVESVEEPTDEDIDRVKACLLYTSPSPRDRTRSRMPSSA